MLRVDPGRARDLRTGGRGNPSQRGLRIRRRLLRGRSMRVGNYGGVRSGKSLSQLRLRLEGPRLTAEGRGTSISTLLGRRVHSDR